MKVIHITFKYVAAHKIDKSFVIFNGRKLTVSTYQQSGR